MAQEHGFRLPQMPCTKFDEVFIVAEQSHKSRHFCIYFTFGMGVEVETRTHYVAFTDLELIEIHLPLRPSESWD